MRSGDASEIVRGHWYAALHARDLSRTRPQSVVRLGERVVLFRDARGDVVAARAACPHRGADLGLGRVTNGEIECPYHGFRFDGGGACVAMPCEGAEAKVPSRMRLTTLPAREAHGFVWLFAGDARDAERAPIPWIPGAPDDTWDAARAELTWGVRLSRAMEAMLDIHHLPFAHRRVMPTARKRLDPYEASIDDDGVIRTKGTLRREDEPASRGYVFHMDARFPGVLHLRLSSTVGGVVVCTPLDEERTWIGARFVARVPYLSRIPLVSRLLAELALFSELTLVQKDDERMVVSSSPRAGGTNEGQLVASDQGMALWHAARRRAIARALPVVDDADGRQMETPRAEAAL